MFLSDRDIKIIEPHGVDEGVTTMVVVQPTEAHIKWLPEAIKRLEALLSLNENWDGYGAAAPVPEFVAAAVGFLKFVTFYATVPIPYVSPTRIGGVLLEWENGPHEMEVEILREDAASYVYMNTETDEDISGHLFSDDADDGKFLGLLNRFFTSETKRR